MHRFPLENVLLAFWRIHVSADSKLYWPFLINLI